MKLDGNAVYYLLKQHFGNVQGTVPSHGPFVDYPLFYDELIDASGHAVIVPDDVLLDADCNMRNAVCVCTGEESARAATEAGFPTVHVRRGISLRHLYNWMQSTYVGHERLEAQLHAYVDTYAGFHSLLAVCAQTMGRPCALVDRRFRIITQAEPDCSDSSWVDDYFEYGDIDLFMSSRGYRRKRAGRRAFVAPGMSDLIMKNVFSGDDPVGILVFSHDGSSLGARYARFLLDYLTPFVERMYARFGSFGAESEGAARIRTALQRALAGTLADPAALDQMLSDELGGVPATYVLLRFERAFTNEASSELDYLVRRVESAWPSVYCAQIGDKLFALAALGDAMGANAAKVVDELPEFARETLVKIGVSRRFSSCSQIDCARFQAEAALEQGEGANPTYWLYRYGDCALPWILSHGKGDAPVSYVAHPALEELSRYDDAHDSDLVRTLGTFMECRYNATEASARLFVARSTLLNRLAKIEELTGVNLASFDERLYLALSFKLLQM